MYVVQHVMRQTISTWEKTKKTLYHILFYYSQSIILLAISTSIQLYPKQEYMSFSTILFDHQEELLNQASSTMEVLRFLSKQQYLNLYNIIWSSRRDIQSSKSIELCTHINCLAVFKQEVASSLISYWETSN